MISKKFIKSSFIYTVAGALPMASAIILLPFYIGFLPTSVYGALSLYLAFSLFVQVLVTYSFDSSLYIHYHEFKADNQKMSSFVSSAFIFMLIIGMVSGVILVGIGDWIFSLVFKDEKISFFPFGLMSVAIGIFQGLFKVYSNLMQSSQRPELFFWSNLLLFTLIAGFTIAGLYIFPSTLMGPIGGRAVAGFIAAVWVLFRISSEFGIHFNFALLKSTFGYNHYTFIYQIQQWIINYFDRFLMVFFLPLSSIGIYDFSLKCLVIIEFIMSGLHNSFYPKVVSTIMAQKEKGSTIELNRYYHGLTAVIMLMISSGILILPFIVDQLDSDKGYQEAIQYLPYIAIMYVLKSLRLYFAAPYGIMKYTKPLPIIYLIVSAIKIAIMVLLINRLGILGVVISSLIASASEIILLKYGVQERFNFQYNIFKLIVTPLVLLGAVLLIEPTVGRGYPVLAHSFYLLLAIVFLFWVYRNELRTLILSKFSGMINSAAKFLRSINARLVGEDRWLVQKLLKIFFGISGMLHQRKVGYRDEFIVIDNFDGSLKLKVNCSWSMGFAIYWSGFHEFREFLFLNKFLKKDMVFVDIGANLGEYSLFAAKRVSAGKVLSFEPLPKMITLLEENIRLNHFTNVHILKYALSDQEGMLPIHEIEDAHEGLSTFFLGQQKSKQAFEVPLKIFDIEIEKLDVNRIDFIKIDIEGGELGALKGAQKSIEKYRPVVMVEINEATYKAARYETKDVEDFFRTLGYTPFYISKNIGLVPCSKMPLLDNVIFKPS